MVTYEITATVAPGLSLEYENYMIRQHIPDLMATGCFASATISKNGDRYRIRYEAHSQGSLDRYLAEHADGLREDFLKHFPVGIEVSRENWDILAAM